MPHEKLRPSFTIDEEKLSQLKQVIPEAFADGKINWEVLKEALGERLEEEGVEAEHFGLFWPGKREARRIASIPSKGTLVPVKGQGIDEENTRNIFIEGENLEVLKLLQKSYAGKIKMIYIDPPYNTGNDFLYDDNFTEPLEEYLKYTGQMDEEGRVLTTNTKADGRFHSKWLSMIYPRLKLARNLLKEDGIIFISIDDNEVQHLRKICDELFGEENFIDSIVWKKRYQGAKEKYHAAIHEYILVYARSKEFLQDFSTTTTEEFIEKYFNLKDEKFSIRGGYRTQPLEAGKSMDSRPNLIYEVPAPDGTKILPKKQWVWGKERVLEALRNNELDFTKDENGKWSVRFKQYLNDKNGIIRRTKPFSIIDNVFTQDGTRELNDMLGDNVFPFPKPSKLIKHLMDVATGEFNKDCIILDFFAGSCTTAHANLVLNKDDGGKRRFICVQLPELIEEDSEAYRAGYKTIAEIGKERIRRVIKNFKKVKKIENNDLGFKVFKLERSNFKLWKDYEGKDLKEMGELFEKWESPLTDDWKEENLTIEIMVQEGFPLDSSTQILRDFKKNKVVEVSSEFCEHKLLVSLDKKIDEDTIKNLNLAGKDIFVCLDSALTDEQKIKLDDKGFLKTI